MDFETVYEETLRQTQQIKSVLDDCTVLRVFDREFRVNHVTGWPRSCQIWGYRDGKNGLVCVGVANISKCKTFQNVREKIAERIAKEIVNS